VAGAEIAWSSDGLEREPTVDEVAFARALAEIVPEAELFLLADADGTPWLMAVHFLPRDGRPAETLRVDFDKNGIKGGWSKTNLSRDFGSRADPAEVDMDPPDGVRLAISTEGVAGLARTAGEWLLGRVADYDGYIDRRRRRLDAERAARDAEKSWWQRFWGT
jgi:hypothetical protein